jgi:hypothetical protein
LKEIRAVLVCGLCSCSLGYRQKIPEREIEAAAAAINVLSERRRRMAIAVVDKWLAEHSHGGEVQLAAFSISTVDATG